MNDLTSFIREHRPLTAAFLSYNAFAALILTGHGPIRTAILLTAFMLAFIWFMVFCALSLLDSYERSKR
jgi:hypothetical protein